MKIVLPLRREEGGLCDPHKLFLLKKCKCDDLTVSIKQFRPIYILVNRIVGPTSWCNG